MLSSRIWWISLRYFPNTIFQTVLLYKIKRNGIVSFIVTIYGISFWKCSYFWFPQENHNFISFSIQKLFCIRGFYAGKMWHVVQCNTFTWLHASHLKDIIPLYGNMHEGRKYKNAIRVVIICIRTKNTLVFYAIIKRCFCFFALPLCYKPSELNHFKTDIVGVCN